MNKLKIKFFAVDLNFFSSSLQKIFVLFDKLLLMERAFFFLLSELCIKLVCIVAFEMRRIMHLVNLLNKHTTGFSYSDSVVLMIKFVTTFLKLPHKLCLGIIHVLNKGLVLGAKMIKTSRQVCQVDR